MFPAIIGVFFTGTSRGQLYVLIDFGKERVKSILPYLFPKKMEAYFITMYFVCVCVCSKWRYVLTNEVYRVFWDVAPCSHFEVDRRFRPEKWRAIVKTEINLMVL
jgi:hypothetical protein